MTANPKPKSMLVAGVMSGTSADGVDVALCRISPSLRPADTPRIKLLGHAGFPYPKAVRAEVLRVMSGAPASTAELSRLNWRLGALYADCVEKAAAQFGIRPALIGLHGQTIHHETTPTRFLGTAVRSTWQIGEPTVIAERLRCTVVSDLRPADLAAGGQGAPLVPMLDYCMFRSAKKNRVLLNLGGIANLTYIPASGSLNDVVAFDTGPGNMVMDTLMQQLFNKSYDHRGRTADRGTAVTPVLEALLREKYFRRKPPKSCGREEFGAVFAARLAQLCATAGGSPQDIIATAMQLTVSSIVEGYVRFCRRQMPNAPMEIIVAGGGVRNDLLMGSLKTAFRGQGAVLTTTDDLGIPAQSKEAVAFALLAWLTIHGLPGNVPSATGAQRPVVLGKVSLG